MATFDSLPNEFKFEILSEIGLQDLSDDEQSRQLIESYIADHLNNFQIYGTMSKDNNFRIINKQVGNNQRLVQQGKLAKTHQKSDLVAYLWELYASVPVDTLSDISEEQIMRLKNYHGINTESFSNYKLKYFYYWLVETNAKREQLSEILHQHFIAMGRMIYT